MAETKRRLQRQGELPRWKRQRQRQGRQGWHGVRTGMSYTQPPMHGAPMHHPYYDNSIKFGADPRIHGRTAGQGGSFGASPSPLIAALGGQSQTAARLCSTGRSPESRGAKSGGAKGGGAKSGASQDGGSSSGGGDGGGRKRRRHHNAAKGQSAMLSQTAPRFLRDLTCPHTCRLSLRLTTRDANCRWAVPTSQTAVFSGRLHLSGADRADGLLAA